MIFNTYLNLALVDLKFYIDTRNCHGYFFSQIMMRIDKYDKLDNFSSSKNDSITIIKIKTGADENKTTVG